jgi:hypothetical protein
MILTFCFGGRDVTEELRQSAMLEPADALSRAVLCGSGMAKLDGGEGGHRTRTHNAHILADPNLIT